MNKVTNQSIEQVKLENYVQSCDNLLQEELEAVEILKQIYKRRKAMTNGIAYERAMEILK